MTAREANGNGEGGSLMQAETIFALASGSGRAAVAVMRISGPRSGAILDALCGRRPAPRHASLRALRSAAGEVLDRGLVLWFPAPRSYTGEDCAELHLHGSRAVTGSVAEALATLGARPAQPGEFTRRAFLNGRMDLLEAEGVADLVEAETQAQQRQALRQMEGALGRLYRGWAARARDALALQEALIDFSDEEISPFLGSELVSAIQDLATEICAHLDDGHRGERIRDGLAVAVVGAPNVGKSSLVNALAGRDLAIVSATPGTTRDVIEARVELAGVPVTLLDTAGMRDSTDPIESEGIRRARQRAESADLVIEIVDEAGVAGLHPGEVLRVANKADLGPHAGETLSVSVHTGHGMDALREAISARIMDLVRDVGPPPLTRERHRAHLTEAARELRQGFHAGWPELRAENLRHALRAIGGITGEIGTEDVLDAIFGRFCIGK